MSKLKKGGQAFPHVKEKGTDYGNGMTLRDYFAGQALAGLMATGQVDSCEKCAKAAYRAADAMIFFREY